MAFTPAENQRRYWERRLALIATMAKIPCGCGCGTTIPPINPKGLPIRYAQGHNPHGYNVATCIKPGETRLAILAVEARRALGILSGPGHPRWSGGETKTGGGYVRATLAPDEAAKHPTARPHKRGGWSIQRSHLVWNRAHPGDPVQPRQHVHHENRIRDDDRIENLRKMTVVAHVRLHRARL